MFCSNCGNKIADKSKFCSVCGNKVNNKKNIIISNDDADENIDEDDDVDIDAITDEIVKNILEIKEVEDEEECEDEPDVIEIKQIGITLQSTAITKSIRSDCKAFDITYKELMNNSGSKILILAEEYFLYHDDDNWITENKYKNAIANYEKHYKIHKNLYTLYRTAQSYLKLAKQNFEYLEYIDSRKELDSALEVINRLNPSNDRGKYLVLIFKGEALNLQAKHFEQDAEYDIKSRFGNGKENHEKQKNTLLKAIDSYKEAIKLIDNNEDEVEGRKEYSLFKIGYLFIELENNKEALKYFLECLSSYSEPFDYYIDKPIFNEVDACIRMCIFCYSQLEETENCAILLSKYLDLHEDEELEDWVLELKETCIAEGYDEYF